MNKPTQKPQAILFDWDNTLADTWGIIYKSLEQTFLTMGHKPMSFEEVKGGHNGIHGSLRDSFPKIFGDKWEEARAHYYDNFLKVHLDEIKVIEGAQEVLDIIADKGIYMAVVSNKTGDYLRQEVTHLGWDNYFSAIIGATDCKQDKPSPDPVYKALEGSNIIIDKNRDNEHIWFIGDSDTDINTAQNARIKPLRFATNSINGEQVVNNHQELFDLINNL